MSTVSLAAKPQPNATILDGPAVNLPKVDKVVQDPYNGSGVVEFENDPGTEWRVTLIRRRKGEPWVLMENMSCESTETEPTSSPTVRAGKKVRSMRSKLRLINGGETT